MAVIEFEERKLMSNLTFTVHIKKNPFRNIGLLLIRAGCWIAGVGYEEVKE